MKNVNQKVMDIIALMLECGVKKEDLAKLSFGLFDISYLDERDVLVRLHSMTQTFNQINEL